VTGSRRLPFRIVDAFAEAPFGGNPAAVVLPDDLATGGHDGESLPDGVLQSIATELNLSETAFPSPPDPTRDGVRRLRWFTPTTEVSLCGHATLAAAHALVEAGAHLPLEFQSRSGPLRVTAGPGGTLELDFPIDPPREGPAPDGLLAALGLDGVPGSRFATGSRCALVELPGDPGSGELLGALEPDFRALGAVNLPDGVMGVSVTVAGGQEGAHFRSRFFGPWVGVDEDPVTGMAHCLLAAWWAPRLGPGAMEAIQGKARTGRLRVRVEGDRVHLSGRAFTVAEGTLHLP
jgi:PhzF family phenazine biosynthesis protein